MYAELNQKEPSMKHTLEASRLGISGLNATQGFTVALTRPSWQSPMGLPAYVDGGLVFWLVGYCYVIGILVLV